jgi:hypothetical protein
MRDTRYREAKATKRRGKGHEKSESAGSTEEAGEPNRRDPVEGSGGRELRNFSRDRCEGH